MKVGFDYWQVLSHYPEQFTVLVNSLICAGHQVYVLSAVGKNRAGTVGDEVTWDLTYQSMRSSSTTYASHQN